MSKTSEELFRQIQAEFDRRTQGEGSMDELNKIAAEVTARHNRTGIAEFEGLSPEQMYAIHYKQFMPECPVRFSENISPDTIIASPVIQASRVILDAIEKENGLKLTVRGNLPRRVVNDIFSLVLVPDQREGRYRLKVLNEFDYYPAAVINALLKVAGITKVKNNRMQFTRKGCKLIRDNMQLFKAVFTTFTSRYNKGYLDGYGDNEIGNAGLLYVIYLLHRYGTQKREETFYARLYFRAFPELIDEIERPFYSTPEQIAYNCLTLRVFDKGLHLFGLIDITYTSRDYLTRSALINTTPLFHHVFDVSGE